MKSRMAEKEFFSSALFSRLDITLSTKSPSSQVESRYAYHLHSSLFLHPARIEQTPRSGYLRIVVTRCYSYTRRRRTQHRQQHENERPRKRSKKREGKKREKTSNTVSGEHVSLAHEKKEHSSIFWFDEPLPNVFFRIEDGNVARDAYNPLPFPSIWFRAYLLVMKLFAMFHMQKQRAREKNSKVPEANKD